MKKLLMLGAVVVSTLFSLPASADVQTRAAIGAPPIVLAGGKHDHAHHPQHRHSHAPNHRRHYGPPAYYPEKVYRNSKHRPHYGHYKHVRPPIYGYHFHKHGKRPVPPPHARAHLWRH